MITNHTTKMCLKYIELTYFDSEFVMNEAAVKNSLTDILDAGTKVSLVPAVACDMAYKVLDLLYLCT
jgi:hypothetical protein